MEILNGGENTDFRNIALDQQKDAPKTNWSGSLIDYMKQVEAAPEIANLSPARIYNMIMKKGTSPVEKEILTKGYEDLVLGEPKQANEFLCLLGLSLLQSQLSLPL